MIDLQEVIDECAVFYEVEKMKNGGMIKVPFCHWPESHDFFTIGIFEEGEKVFLTDIGTSIKYLRAKDINIEDYKERMAKIMKEFDLYEGKGKTLNFDIYKPNDPQFVMLCISRFLQAMTFMTKIEF